MSNSRKSLKLGNLTPKRDFNYVEDICNGFYKAAKTNISYGNIINLCTGYDISIRQLVKIISKEMRVNAFITPSKKRIRPNKSEVFRLCGSNKKAKKLIKWKPKYSNEDSLRNALRKTIKWFLENNHQNSNNKKKYII